MLHCWRTSRGRRCSGARINYRSASARPDRKRIPHHRILQVTLNRLLERAGAAARMNPSRIRNLNAYRATLFER